MFNTDSHLWVVSTLKNAGQISSSSGWLVRYRLVSNDQQIFRHPVFHGSNQAACWQCGCVGPVAPENVSPKMDTVGSLLGSEFCSLMVFAGFVSSRIPPPESWFLDIGHGTAEDSPRDSQRPVADESGRGNPKTLSKVEMPIWNDFFLQYAGCWPNILPGSFT